MKYKIYNVVNISHRVMFKLAQWSNHLHICCLKADHLIKYPALVRRENHFIGKLGSDE